jgi:LPS-assembly protein
VDRLTRLYINTGITLDRLTFAIQEFYFHKSGEHKLTSSATLNFDRFSVAADFTYNSFNSSNTPVTKLVGYDFTLNINDLITLKNSLDYNIESKLINQSSYSVLYAPVNDCWKIEFNYTRDLIDKKFGLLLYINYNADNFTSINVR